MSDITTTPINRTSHFRSTQTVEMVRVSRRRDGTDDVIRAEMPIGLGWGDGTVLQWINKGWQSASDYDAKKHSEDVKAKQDAEVMKKYSDANRAEYPTSDAPEEKKAEKKAEKK